MCVYMYIYIYVCDYCVVFLCLFLLFFFFLFLFCTRIRCLLAIPDRPPTSTLKNCHFAMRRVRTWAKFSGKHAISQAEWNFRATCPSADQNDQSWAATKKVWCPIELNDFPRNFMKHHETILNLHLPGMSIAILISIFCLVRQFDDGLRGPGS